MEKLELDKWLKRIKESDDDTATKSVQWQVYRRMWQMRLPRFTTEKEQQFRANTYVPIVHSAVFSFAARELMYIFGIPDSITTTVDGSRDSKKLQELEDMSQSVFSILLQQPKLFPPMCYGTQDKYVYGNIGYKVLPHRDKYKIAKTDVILPWNFLKDANAATWEECAWAGHRKLVSKEYLLNKPYYDTEIIEKLEEKNAFKQQLNIRGDLGEGKGILISEIWDKTTGKFFTLAEDDLLIREPTDFPYDIFPYVWGSCYGESNTPWGFGIAFILRWIQYYTNYIRNMRIQNLITSVVNALVVPSHGVVLGDVKNLRPGGFVRVDDMNQAPKQLYAVDISRGLEEEIAILSGEAEKALGLTPYAQSQVPSKRMTTPEVMALSQGSGRFWLTAKLAESQVWVPWANIILQYMAHAPKDLFAKLVGKTSRTPADLKKHKIQARATMSQNVLNDEERKREVTQFLTIMQAAPQFLKMDKLVELLVSTFRRVDGIKGVIKSNEEVETDRQKLMEQMAQAQQIANLQGGGGRMAVGPLRPEGR